MRSQGSIVIVDADDIEYTRSDGKLVLSREGVPAAVFAAGGWQSAKGMPPRQAGAPATPSEERELAEGEQAEAAEAAASALTPPPQVSP